MSDFVQIGYIQKTHGVEGELRVHIEEDFAEDFLNCNALFIETGGQMLPFFIEYIRGANDDILKLEDVGSREEAQKLGSQPVFLRKADMLPPEEKENKPYAPQFDYLEGFNAHEKEKGPLGAIIRVDEYPQQEMAVVRYMGREVLIPLNDRFISSIDVDKKTIVFELPEGLLHLTS